MSIVAPAPYTNAHVGSSAGVTGPGSGDSAVEQPEIVLSRIKMRGFSPDRLVHARERLGLTQEDLAVAANIAPATISHWETGRSSPSPAPLVLVAEVLGLSIADLCVTPLAARTLAQLRQQAGLAQVEAARALGVPESTWGMIERGARQIGDHRVDQVAALLKVDVMQVERAWELTRSRRVQRASSS